MYAQTTHNLEKSYKDHLKPSYESFVFCERKEERGKKDTQERDNLRLWRMIFPETFRGNCCKNIILRGIL